ncbi:hypothetical protein [Arenimonas fontis]|uniref:DUF3617 domain-containing protein n=1 Tax=Arenimonas fontis TaxID=2608255 RepID=A0A5B2ZBD9_9GAMM|nr:hypothetical protein [Arenimonas fontis]KAA2284471.1 hypothetical protein F0415_09095 [Arenimonas fontis]
MRHPRIGSALVLALVPALAMPVAASVNQAAADLAFADAMDACAAATHQGPHPFVPGFVIEHVVAGEDEAGRCPYSQTMPGGMRMECALSGEGRAALAREFREMAEGRLQGGTADQPAWTGECELVLPDGKRQPMRQ